MRCVLMVVAVTGVLFSALPCRGQQSPDVLELRRQIRAMEESLRVLEESDGGPRRVTEIGGGRTWSPGEPTLVVRIYDLGDLFAAAPDYPAQRDCDLSADSRSLFPAVSMERTGMGMGGMGGMGGGMGGWAVRPESLKTSGSTQPILPQLAAGSDSLGSGRTSIDDLIEAITSTISVESWDEVGGPASITSLGNSLLVSADDQTHRQIDALLQLFQKRWGTLQTVSVRAYWLWLTDGELAGLLAPEGTPVPEELPPFGVVDSASWKELLAENAARGEGERPAGYRAVISCYNGQRVHTVSGGQSVAVTGVIPVPIPVYQPEEGEGVESPTAVTYEPIVSIVQEGAALEVTPVVAAGGKFVVLNLRSRVVEQRKQPVAAPAPASTASAVSEVIAAIDRPMLNNHRLSTTLHVPVGRPMLVGGMTYQSVPKPGEPGLYLFVNLSIHELPEAEIQSPPAIQEEDDAVEEAPPEE